MNTKKILYGLLACMMFGVSFWACSDNDTVYVGMSKHAVSINLKDTLQLTVNVQGADLGDFKWEIIEQTPDDPSFGDVLVFDESHPNSGFVVAKNYGTAMVKATASNGRYALSEVSVTEQIGFQFAQRVYYFDPFGSTDTLELTIDPSFIKDNELKVFSTDTTVLKVDVMDSIRNPAEGIYRLAVFPRGQQRDEPVEIMATLGERQISCNAFTQAKLYLSMEPFTGITITTIEQKDFKMHINNSESASGLDTVLVYFKSMPNDDETLKKIPWEIETEGDVVEIVSQGLSEKLSYVYEIVVKTSAESGYATINLKAWDCKVAANVEVYNREDYPVESVELFTTEVEVTDIPFKDLFDQVEVSPFGITDYWPVVWSSSDEKIATVNADGYVVCLAPGVAKITATARDKSAVCTFTVKLKGESVAFDADAPKSMVIGETSKMALSVKAKLPTVPSTYFAWESSKTDVATVTEDGTVKALAAGETVIKVTFTDDLGNVFTAEQNLTVIDPESIPIKDIAFAEGTVYQKPTPNSILIYNQTELENGNEDNYVSLVFDQLFDPNADGVYNLGKDLTGTVQYKASSGDLKGVVVDLIGGTITASNGVLTLDATVGKSVKTVKFTGTIKPE